MTKFFQTILLVGALALSACNHPGTENGTDPDQKTDSVMSDSAFLDLIQKASMNYMWDGAEATSGLAFERIHLDGEYGGNDPEIVTTGGSGFGIAGLVVAMERGFITREAGVERLQKIVSYLKRADRFHGVWSHWIKGPTGHVVPFGSRDNGGDLVESSFLMQGLLVARQYMKPEVPAEKAVIDGINELWHAMEFDWYRRDGQNVIYWHWSPDQGWVMNFPLEGYNECMIVYILAASSPTHSCPAECYHQGWARNGGIKTNAQMYGLPLLLKHNGCEFTGGPLFWAHYSWFGLCPKGLSDQYADYWTAMQNHAKTNYLYCVANPKGYPNYGEDCWGLTASYSVSGYEAHAPACDKGVITPTAALSSFPYTPEESMRAARYFYSKKALLWTKYGFIDAFSQQDKWYPKHLLAIDQLTIAPMIENYRTGLIWDLFMSCPEIKVGLERLGINSTYFND